MCILSNWVLSLNVLPDIKLKRGGVSKSSILVKTRIICPKIEAGGKYYRFDLTGWTWLFLGEELRGQAALILNFYKGIVAPDKLAVDDDVGNGRLLELFFKGRLDLLAP